MIKFDTKKLVITLLAALDLLFAAEILQAAG
jgi:hypothetical protein